MNFTKKFLLLIIFLISLVNADETTFTDISFSVDEDGNLNPNISIPIYYDDSKQFSSTFSYFSSNSQSLEKVENFSDSKNAFLTQKKELKLGFLRYRTKLFDYDISIGAETTFSDIRNNEFGYIHDKKNIFLKGEEYYISFDNEIKLNLQRYAIDTNILIPIGKHIISKLTLNISPYTKIDVKQSTIFKPLVEQTGKSSNQNIEKLSYIVSYDALIKTDTFFDIVVTSSYTLQPIKYDIAQLDSKDNKYIFTTNTIDTTEMTFKYNIKLIFDKKIIGKLKPSIGYGIETLKVKNNLTNKIVTTDKKVLIFGLERKF